MSKIFIDIGSSTIKTYSLDGNKLELVDEFSTLFKDGFTNEAGVAADKIAQLLGHLEKWRGQNVQTFATGIWREIPSAQLEYLKANSPIGFNVISHEDEARYLKQAADLPYNGKKVLVINMGGKTTEAITVNRDGTTESKMLNLGVANLSKQFPNVTDTVSSAPIEEMEAFCAQQIASEEFDTDYDFALLTGELRFQKLTEYPLGPNTMFVDANHPHMQSLEEFIAGTRRIFYDLTMEDLFALMPKNPTWMTGARQGAILPLAIFRKANIETIVPSDINLINGVVRGV
ncbi:MAG: hypothetical protein FWD33_01520 [Alphaproteobacteria bacterium]|nr:hypothetical protein [Alphaproteobacteria bacterium]